MYGILISKLSVGSGEKRVKNLSQSNIFLPFLSSVRNKDCNCVTIWNKRGWTDMSGYMLMYGFAMTEHGLRVQFILSKSKWTSEGRAMIQRS